MAASPLNQRHHHILTIMHRLRSVSVSDLTKRLNVSEVTIRKDLTTLEEMGYLIRTHGGAEPAEDKNFRRTLTVRRKEQMDKKKAIAQAAARFVREDDTVFIDSGSTGSLLAEEIKHMNIRVVTNSLDVMNILADTPGVTLITLGGNYRKEAGSFIGPVAEENLSHFQMETCFIGATGFTADGAFMCQNIIESRLKKQALTSSNRKIIIADSSKYQRTAFAVFAEPADLDVLITDDYFSDGPLFQHLGIEVVQPGG